MEVTADSFFACWRIPPVVKGKILVFNHCFSCFTSSGTTGTQEKYRISDEGLLRNSSYGYGWGSLTNLGCSIPGRP